MRADGPFIKLGDRIRSVRIRQRMTVNDLAEATGISQGALSNIEHGHKDVRLSTLVRIAAALGVQIAYLTPFDVANAIVKHTMAHPATD